MTLRGCNLSLALLLAVVGTPGMAGPLVEEIAPGEAPEAQFAEPSAEVVALRVNGTGPVDAIVVYRDPRYGYLIPAEVLASRRVRIDGLVVVQIDGADHVALNAIDGATVRLDPSTMAFELQIPAAWFEGSTLNVGRRQRLAESEAGAGAYLNYDLTAWADESGADVAGFVEGGRFAGPTFVSASAAFRSAGSTAGIVRLETNWSYDDPAGMSAIRAGDLITRGGTGGRPLRMAGIQVARDFSVQPGFVTLPTPELRGSAALASTVDVFVDNIRVDRQEVNPGAFDVVNAPVVTGNGTVDLVVRDMLGRQQVISQAYYVAPTMLRPGLEDYSYEIGFLRENYGQQSFDYGSAAASFTWRRGLSRHVTTEVHGEATVDTQMLGLASVAAWPGIGAITVSAAASNGPRGTGSQVGIGYQRQGDSFTIGGSAQFTSADYMSVGLGELIRIPRRSAQAFVGVPTGFGSFSLSYLRRDFDDPDDQEFVSASGWFQIGDRLSVGLTGNIDLAKSGGTSAMLNLTAPFGRREVATAAVRRTERGLSATAAFQRSLPVGEGVGYRVAAQAGEDTRIEAAGQVQTAAGRYEAGVGYAGGRVGATLSASGAVGTMGGQHFATRRIDRAFALVKTGKAEGVRVYADNQQVATTGKNGYALIPNLRSFEPNKLSIDFRDLPLDADVSYTQKVVRPYRRAGVVVSFPMRSSASGIARIQLADGSWLPAGAAIEINGEAADVGSAPDGEVFLTGLEQENIGVARWGEGECSFLFAYPDTDDPQPDLGVLQCR